MKHYARFSPAIVLTVGLILTGFNATAATSDRNSSLSITTHGLTSFSHFSEISFIDFNNHMADFTSTGKNSSFAQVSNGASFDKQLDFYRTHPVFAHEEPHHEFVDFREEHRHKWDWDERPVSAVPEPAEYVLMACGLGLIGLVAIRRRTDQGFATV